MEIVVCLINHKNRILKIREKILNKVSRQSSGHKKNGLCAYQSGSSLWLLQVYAVVIITIK